MKKVAFLMVAGLTAGWLVTSLVLAAESRAAKINSLLGAAFCLSGGPKEEAFLDKIQYK